jgi:hypothetical protein
VVVKPGLTMELEWPDIRPARNSCPIEHHPSASVAGRFRDSYFSLEELIRFEENLFAANFNFLVRRFVLWTAIFLDRSFKMIELREENRVLSQAIYPDKTHTK